MKVAVSMFFLLACTAACGTSRFDDPSTARPAAPSQSWTAIALHDISRDDVRRTITDLLGLVDFDSLWPEFSWNDHGVILSVDREGKSAVAYCVGICVPEIAAGGASRLFWLGDSPVAIAPGEFRFMPLSIWSLSGSDEVVAIGFNNREQSVLTAVHEDFHLHYQGRYAVTFGDAIGPSDEMSRATRTTLENDYSRSDPTAGELRDECVALVDALHAGTGDRRAAMAALRHFAAIRESRRARPSAPTAEEDYWERQEGVPTNLERRAAAWMKFADQSAVATALTGRGCETITSGSYFLVLGGLQAAVLDTFADHQAWPHRVYPRDGTRASSLFALVRALSLQSEER